MSKRNVFEVGLMHEGFSVVRRQLIESADLNQTPFLIGELLSIIQGFSTTSYNKTPNVFQMEGFTVSLHRFKCGGKENIFLLYAISLASTKYLRKTLENLATELKTHDSILLNWNLDTESLRNLFPIFDGQFLPYKM